MNQLLNKFLSLFLRKLPGEDDYAMYLYRGWTVIVRNFYGADPLCQRYSIGVKRQIEDKPCWEGAWTYLTAEAWPFLTELDKVVIIHMLMEDAVELPDGVTPHRTIYTSVCHYNDKGSQIGYDIVRQEPAQ